MLIKLAINIQILNNKIILCNVNNLMMSNNNKFHKFNLCHKIKVNKIFKKINLI